MFLLRKTKILLLSRVIIETRRVLSKEKKETFLRCKKR